MRANRRREALGRAVGDLKDHHPAHIRLADQFREMFFHRRTGSVLASRTDSRHQKRKAIRRRDVDRLLRTMLRPLQNCRARPLAHVRMILDCEATIGRVQQSAFAMLPGRARVSPMRVGYPKGIRGHSRNRTEWRSRRVHAILPPFALVLRQRKKKGVCHEFFRKDSSLLTNSVWAGRQRYSLEVLRRADLANLK